MQTCHLNAYTAQLSANLLDYYLKSSYEYRDFLSCLLAPWHAREVIDTLPRFEYCSRKTSLDRADFPVEADDPGGADKEGGSFCCHLADSPSFECCSYNASQMTLSSRESRCFWDVLRVSR